MIQTIADAIITHIQNRDYNAYSHTIHNAAIIRIRFCPDPACDRYHCHCQTQHEIIITSTHINLSKRIPAPEHDTHYWHEITLQELAHPHSLDTIYKHLHKCTPPISSPNTSST